VIFEENIYTGPFYRNKALTRIFILTSVSGSHWASINEKNPSPTMIWFYFRGPIDEK